MQNSRGNPLSGGAKYTGWEKFAVFVIYLGNGTIPIVTTEHLEECIGWFVGFSDFK